MYRTMMLGEVNEKLIGQTIELAGWVNTVRDHGGIVFIDLRDKTGVKTRKEWNEFKTFIETQINGDGWWIRNCACKIVDEYEELKRKNK